MAEAAVLTPPSAPPITTVDESGWYIKGLIYGQPGAGKTYLGCTMPEPIILLTEGDVARPTILRAQKDLGKKVPIWPIASVKDLEQAYLYLRNGDHSFKSVVLDSITDMNRIVMEEAVGSAKARKAEHDPDLLDIKDWNRVDQRMRKILRSFRDLDMHVLMLALAGEVMEGITGPALYPKGLRTEAAALFNCVGYLGRTKHPETEQEVRVLIFGDAQRQGKNPGGMVDPYVLDPRMDVIIQKIQGEDDA